MQFYLRIGRRPIVERIDAFAQFIKAIDFARRFKRAGDIDRLRPCGFAHTVDEGRAADIDERVGQRRGDDLATQAMAPQVAPDTRSRPRSQARIAAKIGVVDPRKEALATVVVMIAPTKQMDAAVKQRAAAIPSRPVARSAGTRRPRCVAAMAPTRHSTMTQARQNMSGQKPASGTLRIRSPLMLHSSTPASTIATPAA